MSEAPLGNPGFSVEVGVLPDLLIVSFMKCTREAAVAIKATLATHEVLWLEGSTGAKPAQAPKSSVSPPKAPVQEVSSKNELEEGIAGICDITDQSWSLQALAFTG
ncbi:hypothetical protein BTVI_88333 [Pitangus sulphuratus]|nr:hypothetical protein BTVI_88333 [Pitangus sulphuratus]